MKAVKYGWDTSRVIRILVLENPISSLVHKDHTDKRTS